ncbi:hypothetical protein ACFU9X_43145 [Streptomyces atratus]
MDDLLAAGFRLNAPELRLDRLLLRLRLALAVLDPAGGVAFRHHLKPTP